MSTYQYGRSRTEQAASLDRQLRSAALLEKTAHETAAKILADADTAARALIAAAIAQADRIRAATDKKTSRALIAAEHEANRIRERAYLEGRARADAQRIEHDRHLAATQRREALATGRH
ncbi:hypothetical protein ACQCSX_04235 [Pseudarthrobacter sp. P1]|uniref:hypothetical protein n=1 Tax=Pseudarthrobacter sp. P1 TaxID=3418418 RepID=UPI003CE8F6C8